MDLLACPIYIFVLLTRLFFNPHTVHSNVGGTVSMTLAIKEKYFEFNFELSSVYFIGDADPGKKCFGGVSLTPVNSFLVILLTLGISVASGLPNRTDGLLPPAWGSNKGLPPQHAACGGEAGQSWIPTFPSYTLRQLRNVTVPSTMYPDYLCEQSVNQLSMLHLHGYVSTCLCLASIPSTVYVLPQHVTVPTNLFSCTYSPSTSFLRSST
jgi:hypothetical protein